MKVNPATEFDQGLADTTRTRDFLKGLKRSIDEAATKRSGWINKLDHFRRRRYTMEFRNPTYPWPGSSSIVPPLIDKKIDELKPQYLNLITAAKPPVTVLAMDKASQAKVPYVEMWFEWLIKFGSPRFVEEIILAVDDMLETGRCILKSTWFYECAPAPETIKPNGLPARLRQLIVTARAEKDADLMFASGSGPILTRKEFDDRRELIERVIESEFDLDPEEDLDKRAINQIVNWLRSGANEPLQLEKRDVRTNVPGIVAVSPKDLIVPEWTTDVEQSEFMTHRMWFNPFKMKAQAKSSGWDMTVIDEILKDQREKQAKRSGNSSVDIGRAEEAMREGVSFTGDDQIEVYETCTWFSPKKGGDDMKVVILTAKDYPDRPLKMTAYQRPSGNWPYHTATFEMNKRRWYSPRGVPEKLDDLEYEIIQQHRGKLNRMTIANAPTFTYEMASGINPANYRWIPGQFYPVRKQGAVQPLVIPNLDISFEKEEQILRTWAEEYLGGTDFGLNSPLSSSGEPRTATEIQAITGKSRQSLSLRGTIFQRMMADVYRELFDMHIYLGDQSSYVRVTGSDPIKLTKEQLQGRYEFIPTGTIGEQDPVVEAQRAQQRFIMLAQAASQGLIGDEYEVDLGAALMDFLQKDDPRAAAAFIRKRSPQEVQAIQQQKAQAAAQQQQMQAELALAGAKPNKAADAGMPMLPSGAR